MSELMDQYVQMREQLVELLVKHHNFHMAFMRSQGERPSRSLRMNLKSMRMLIKEMEKVAMARTKEATEEYLTKYPKMRGRNNKKKCTQQPNKSQN